MFESDYAVLLINRREEKPGCKQPSLEREGHIWQAFKVSKPLSAGQILLENGLLLNEQTNQGNQKPENINYS